MNTDKRAVAVLMSVYEKDDVALLGIALDSVVSQKLDRAIHVYFYVDGPVSEHMRAFLNSRQGELHRVTWSNANVGLSVALNALIEQLGNEEFVFRMDADDISLPGRFAKQIAYLEDHKEISLVGSQAFDIDDNGVVTGERDYPVDPKDNYDALERVTPVLHPTYCIRASILKYGGIRYPLSYLTEDLAFLCLLAKRGVLFANIPDRVFCWRIGKDFLRRRHSARRGLQEFKAYSSIVSERHGLLSPKQIFPLARLLLALLPPSLAGVIRATGVRRRILHLREETR